MSKIFKFRFDLKDVVWNIGFYIESKLVKCTACDGKGEIDLMDGGKTSCPKCGFHNPGFATEYGPRQWNVKGVLTIGQQRVYINSGSIEERYMCVETGIGSGTIQDPDDFFLTSEEAERECKKRNKKEK